MKKSAEYRVQDYLDQQQSEVKRQIRRRLSTYSVTSPRRQGGKSLTVLSNDNAEATPIRDGSPSRGNQKEFLLQKFPSDDNVKLTFTPDANKEAEKGQGEPPTLQAKIQRHKERAVTVLRSGQGAMKGKMADKTDKKQASGRLPLEDKERMRQEINAPAMEELYSVIANFDTEQRMLKAARHLKDAMYLRPIRHDIDTSKSKFMRFCYFLQTAPSWQTFLYIVSWAHMALAIFEPAHSGQNYFYDEYPSYKPLTITFEIVFILLYGFEVFLEIYHRSNDYKKKGVKERYLDNLKIVSKVIFVFLFFLDFLIFYGSLPTLVFRFSRPLRPFSLALYQKQLRRTVTGIIQSMKQMLDIILFFTFVAVIYAVIGVRVIGDLDGEVEYDRYASDFNSFGRALNNLYILYSSDNYPTLMQPSLKSSPWYVCYFVPFVLVNILLLIPIPIAVMFQAFRNHRGKLVVKDRVKEREALFACFVCMDEDYSMKVEWDEFKNLFDIVYREKLKPDKIHELFGLLDEDQKGFINLDGFFNLIDNIENNKDLTKPEIVSFKWWDHLRAALNKIFCFEKISKSNYFEAFMMLVVLFNTVILVMFTFESDQDTLDLLNEIDNALVWIYTAEVIIKILGMGIYPYFSDSWNVMDFVLTVISLATNIALQFTKVARTAKTTRLFKSVRTQRLFKMFRALRGMKLCKCCLIGVNSLVRVKRLVQNIAICFPIVLKLATILFMITYLYAIVGMEIYHTDKQVHEQSEYIAEQYTSFNNIGAALLSLLQVIAQSGWSTVEYDYAARYESLVKSAFYFNTYHALANLIIISLLTGLIWEVFAFMDKNLNEQAQIEELLAEINIMNETYHEPDPNKPGKQATNDFLLNQGFGGGNDDNLKKPNSKSFNDDKDQIKAMRRFTGADTLIRRNPGGHMTLITRNDIQSGEFEKKPSSLGDLDLGSEPSAKQELLNSGQPSDKKRLLNEIGTINEEDEFIEKSPNLNGTTKDLSDSTTNGAKKANGFDFNGGNIVNETPNKPSAMKNPVKEVLNNNKNGNKNVQFIQLKVNDQTSAGGGGPNVNSKASDKNGTLSTHPEKVQPNNVKGDQKTPKLKHIVNTESFGGETSSSSESDDDQSSFYGGMEDKNTIKDNKVLQNIGVPKLTVKEGSKRFSAFANSDLKSYQRPVEDFQINMTTMMRENSFRDDPYYDDRLDEANSKRLQLEFYKKKITVCVSFSAEKNPFDFILQGKKGEPKKKFANEIVYLRLLDQEEEEEKKLEKQLFSGKPGDLLLNIKDPKIKKVVDKVRAKMDFKKKKLDFYAPTVDRIIRKALLQGADINSIKEFEEGYLRDIYGSWFDFMTATQAEEYLNMFRIENNCVMRFMRLMKQPDLVAKDFIDILNMIEASIYKNLAPKGSVNKFLFKDSQGRWFCISRLHGEFKLTYLKYGFWHFFEQLFHDKTKLYEGQDILFEGSSGRYDTTAQNLHTSLRRIAKRADQPSFLEFERAENVWNLYTIPFETSSFKSLRGEVIKSTHHLPNVKISDIPENMITQGIFVSVNHITRTNKMNKKDQIQRYNQSFSKSSKTLSSNKSNLLGEIDDRPERLRVIQMTRKNSLEANEENANNYLKPRRQNSLELDNQKTPQDDAALIENIRRRSKLATKHFVGRNDLVSRENLRDKINSESKGLESLPPSEYINFMNDLRDVLNVHRDYMLFKTSVFYLNQKFKQE